MSIPIVNLEEIKEKLVEKLKPSGWANKLRGFIQSSDFDKIFKVLYTERLNDKRFTPPLKDVFKAFEECPLDKLKVVIIGQDPYPQLGVADGIAFSCKNTMIAQPSLKHLFNGLDATVNKDVPFELDHNPDLTRWANQGVLLLNSSLTCQVDKPGSHYKIWNDFITYTLDMLCSTHPGLIFVLLGSKAQELESLINPNQYIIKASHPASAGYSKTDWDCNDLFNKINVILEQNNGPEFKIEWN